jgi:hypothetical protein
MYNTLGKKISAITKDDKMVIIKRIPNLLRALDSQRARNIPEKLVVKAPLKIVSPIFLYEKSILSFLSS